MDKNELRLLESSENVRAFTRLRTGRSLSSTVARELTACIQQGRLFYESAIAAPLEIRPLVQFYGALSFAKALVIGTRQTSISTLAQGHGIRDVSTHADGILAMRAKIGGRGTFAEFNDAVRGLNNIEYHDQSTNTKYLNVPTATSSELNGITVSLKEVLARLPSLNNVYRHTFAEGPRNNNLNQLWPVNHENGLFSFLFTLDKPLTDLADTAAAAAAARSRFPFLDRWRVTGVFDGWDSPRMEFSNYGFVPSAEFIEDEWVLGERPGTFRWQPVGGGSVSTRQLDGLFQGVGRGPLAKGLFAIEAVETQYVSEFALQYIALFLLSSLVRYRPNVWAHAISRSVTTDRPADDSHLALVQAFLDTVQLEIPALVVRTLNPHVR